ncbi:hypothetical protein PIB30_008807 [Stylosanthes scabra]|uniref:Secreted protein n=1 Tax=Stylosanthes scabra TaxID=79078 RepID=A0ABU6X4G9_9FABA|nr:hypothetical protein [Stylosanthes scabra]
MATLWQAVVGLAATPATADNHAVEFWWNPERTSWLQSRASTSKRGAVAGSSSNKGTYSGSRTQPSRARRGHAASFPWRLALPLRARRTRSSTSPARSSCPRSPTRCTSSPIRRRRSRIGSTPLVAPLFSILDLSLTLRSSITTNGDSSRASNCFVCFSLNQQSQEFLLSFPFYRTCAGLDLHQTCYPWVSFRLVPINEEFCNCTYIIVVIIEAPAPYFA